MLPDEKEWAAVNQLLSQQGLTQIVILNEINVNDYVWLTLEASKSLRLTIQTLIDDCQRKQILVRELIITNEDLRDQLKAQSVQIEGNNHMIEEMKRILDNHTGHTSHLNPSDHIHPDDVLLPRLESHRNNANSAKTNGVNYSHQITKLDLIRKTHSDSEIQQKYLVNKNNCQNLENMIDKLKLEIKALKREQEKMVENNIMLQKQNFEAIFKELHVNDTPSALKKIRSNMNKQYNHELTKQFIHDLNVIINDADKDPIHINKHEITCNKSLQEMKSIISLWANQIASIPDLINQINALLISLFPHKLIIPLDTTANIQQINNFITEILPHQFDNFTNMPPVKDEKIDAESLPPIIEYVQMVFGIKSIRGIYAGLSVVYRRLSELENMMKSLSSILFMDEKMTSSKLVAMVTHLYKCNQNRDHHLEKELLQLAEVVEKQETYISIFQKLVSELLLVLHIDAPDQILPAVANLVNVPNRIILD